MTHARERWHDTPDGYLFWHTIRFLRMGKLDPTVVRSPNSVVISRWYRTGPATLQFEWLKTGVRVRAWGVGSDEALEHSRDWLGLNDTPVTDFGNPRINHRVRAVMGTHLIRSASVSHELVQHVLQQKIAWRDAARIWSRLIERYGESAPGPFERRMPLTFQQLRGLSASIFQEAGLAVHRVAALREIGRLGYRIDGWLEESPACFRQRVQALPGIGPWTANHVLAVAMGYPDVIVPGDYTLPHTVSWALTGQPRGTDATMMTLLEPFKGNRWRLCRLFWALDIAPPRRGPRMNSRHTRRG